MDRKKWIDGWMHGWMDGSEETINRYKERIKFQKKNI